MLWLTIKGLLARKRRLFTTALAVTLGVAFMSGTLVLTDTIGKTFDDMFGSALANTDVQVRQIAAFEGVPGADTADQRGRVEPETRQDLAPIDAVGVGAQLLVGAAAEDEPVDLAVVGEAEQHLVHHAVGADGARHRDELGVGRIAVDKVVLIEPRQLLLSHAAGHGRDGGGHTTGCGQ